MSNFIKVGLNKNQISNIFIKKRIFYLRYPYYVKIEMNSVFEPEYNFVCQSEEDAIEVKNELLCQINNSVEKECLNKLYKN